MDPIITGALIGAGSSLLGGLFGAGDSGDLADAIKQATEFQKKVYSNTQADLAPYKTLGQEGNLGSLLDYTYSAATAESPLYKMQMQDTLDALNREAAARGSYFSPRQVEQINSDAIRRLTAQEADARYGRALGLLDLGFNASATGGQLGQGAASNMTGLAGLYGYQSSPWPSALAGVNQAVQGGLGNYYTQQFLDKASTPNMMVTGGFSAAPTLGNYSVYGY